LQKISKELSNRAILIGIDRDLEAIAAATDRLKGSPQKVKIFKERFSRFDSVLQSLNIKKVHGILCDLGVSSHQIDNSNRGFSFMQDGPLDMRMDKEGQLTAAYIVNEYDEGRLTEILKKYAEEKKPRRVARAIIKQRLDGRLKTTGDFRKALDPLFPPARRNSSLARIFQAVRIEVNNELDELETVLPKMVDCLEKGGTVVVISYHSLEDRIVKRFFSEKAKGCTCPDDFPVCVCGRKPELELLTRRVIKPSAGEIRRNSRARSARLRAARKI
jgi:16S rRNA (cytosine1402-N4)-methyltransferase